MAGQSIVRGEGAGRNGTLQYRRLAEAATRMDCIDCRRPRDIEPRRGGCSCIFTDDVGEFNASVRRGVENFHRYERRRELGGTVVWVLLASALIVALLYADRIAAWLGL